MAECHPAVHVARDILEAAEIALDADDAFHQRFVSGAHRGHDTNRPAGSRRRSSRLSCTIRWPFSYGRKRPDNASPCGWPRRPIRRHGPSWPPAPSSNIEWRFSTSHRRYRNRRPRCDRPDDKVDRLDTRRSRGRAAGTSTRHRDSPSRASRRFDKPAAPGGTPVQRPRADSRPSGRRTRAGSWRRSSCPIRLPDDCISSSPKQ